MNPELIVAAFLASSGVQALVGSRVALAQLPQNTTFPAVVYQVVDALPVPEVAYTNGPQRARARVQINPLATSIGQLKQIHAAIRDAMDWQHNVTIGGARVMSCRFRLLGPMDRDNDAGIWTQPADYELTWYE